MLMDDSGKGTFGSRGDAESRNTHETGRSFHSVIDLLQGAKALHTCTGHTPHRTITN